MEEVGWWDDEVEERVERVKGKQWSGGSRPHEMEARVVSPVVEEGRERTHARVSVGTVQQ